MCPTPRVGSQMFTGCSNSHRLTLPKAFPRFGCWSSSRFAVNKKAHFTVNNKLELELEQ